MTNGCTYLGANGLVSCAVRTGDVPIGLALREGDPPPVSWLCKWFSLECLSIVISIW